MKNYYHKINSAILEWRDISKDIIKDKKFYNYLLNNRVASYYSKNLSKQSNEIEKNIIKAGEERNSIFYKTLEELDRVCKKNNIEYLLYKTYKYFDEVIWGDIDIIVKDADFDRFLQVFSDEWWNCIEDEKRKWKCEKDGLIVIEPHVNISWNGNIFFESIQLWKNYEEVTIKWNNYLKTSNMFESLSIYLKIMYEPEYLDLYDYLVLRLNETEINRYERILEWFNYKFVCNLYKNINKIKADTMFPYFFSSIFIFKCNLINLLQIWYFNKRMFIHNMYWKIRYKKNSKLPYLTKYIKL